MNTFKETENYFSILRWYRQSKSFPLETWQVSSYDKLSYIIKIMTADGLVTQGAKTSAAMVLLETENSWNNPASAPE